MDLGRSGCGREHGTPSSTQAPSSPRSCWSRRAPRCSWDWCLAPLLLGTFVLLVRSGMSHSLDPVTGRQLFPVYFTGLAMALGTVGAALGSTVIVQEREAGALEALKFSAAQPQPHRPWQVCCRRLGGRSGRRLHPAAPRVRRGAGGCVGRRDGGCDVDRTGLRSHDRERRSRGLGPRGQRAPVAPRRARWRGRGRNRRVHLAGRRVRAQRIRTVRSESPGATSRRRSTARTSPCCA